MLRHRHQSYLTVPIKALDQKPNILRPTTQDGSLLSVVGGQRLITEASSAVSSQNYPLAETQEARQVFNQMQLLSR